MNLYIEKTPKSEKLTIEGALVEIQEKGIFEEIDLEEQIGICDGYIIKLGYDKNEMVVIDGIEKDTGVRVSAKLTPSSYTKENVKVTISVSGKTITNISIPSGMTKIGDWVYEVTANGTYNVKVTLERGQTLEKEIKVATIDRVLPKDFTPKTEFIKSGFKIIAKAEDGDATPEYVQSGIDYYEYYVDGTKQNSNIITGLAERTYQVYVIAYDKAGNSKNSTTINVEYKEQVPEITLDTDDWVNDKVIATVDWGYAEATDKKEISLDNGESYSPYTGPIEVTRNTTIKVKLTSGEKELIGELVVDHIDKLPPNDFTPTISDLDSDTEFTINANSTDHIADEESAQSGIIEYEYSVYQGNNLICTSGKIATSSWKASNLEVGETYRIQVDVWDRAKNKTSGEKESYEKLPVYTWAQYAADKKTIWNYTKSYYGTIWFYQKNGTYYCSQRASESEGFDSSTGFWTLSEERNPKTTRANIVGKGYLVCNNQRSQIVYRTKSGEEVENEYLGGADNKYDCDVLKSYSQTTYTKKGEILKYVASNNPDQYPENGGQGNYWYEKVSK